MIYQFFQDPIGNIISALEWLAKIPKMIFDLFVDTLTNIIDAVLSIPKKVFNFVKRIFIPQRSVIDDALESLKKSFNKLLFNYKLESISTGAKKFEDISVTMRGKKMVILDSSLIVSGVNKFRSIIRGFTVFLLILFDINQFLGFIGQPAISIVGGIKAIQQSGKSQEGGAE